MTALLAQAASSGEWYDGWHLAAIIITVVVALIGWLYRQMSRGFAESKSDLAAAEKRLEGKIAEVKTDLTGDIAEVKTDLTGKITEVKTDLTGKITEVKTEIVATEKRLTAEIVATEKRLTANIADVKIDLENDIAEVKTGIASVDGDLKYLKDKLYEDALGKVAMYQWQLAAAQPSASEDPSLQPQSQQPAPQPKRLAETSSD